MNMEVINEIKITNGSILSEEKIEFVFVRLKDENLNDEAKFGGKTEIFD